MVVIKQKKHNNKSNEEDNNFIQFSKSTIKTYLLMMSKHFTSLSFYMGNIFIPLLVVLALGNLFPIWYSFIWTLFIGTTFAGMSAYGTLFFIIKNSTIKKNFDMTATESSALYFGTFLMLLTVMTITITVVLFSVFIFDSLNILSHFFFSAPPEVKEVNYTIDWGKVDWLMINHYLWSTTFIIFVLCFFLEQILTTQKNFFIAAFIYLFGGLFFSGLWSPSLYVSTGVLHDEGTLHIIHKSVVNEIGVNPEYDNIISYITMPSYMAGAFPWCVSMFVPHFGLNQTAFYSLAKGWSSQGNLVYDWLPEFTMLTKLHDGTVLMYALQPFVVSIILLVSASLVARYKDK